MADIPAHIVELPLHLGVMTFGAVMIGLGGHDLRVWSVMRANLAASAVGDQIYINDNMFRNIDFAIMILGAITFVWGIICIALTAKQFRGRKGNYTGEGTAAWIPVLLVYLIILGAWTGVTSAYTAFAVQKSWSISAGPALTEPLSEGVRFALYQVGQTFYSNYANNFNIQPNFSFSSVGVPIETIAPWDTATTLEIANTIPLKYLRYQVLKATVICAWMTLAIVFTATVVHFALPLVLKFFGLTREDKRRKEARQLESQEYS